MLSKVVVLWLQTEQAPGQHAVDQALYPTWSWRESNPRPPTLTQDFSGCSLQNVFSAPVLVQTTFTDGLSRVKVPIRSRGET